MDGWQRAANRIYDGKQRMIKSPKVEDWLSFMDRVGIEKTVLYPTAGLAHGLISNASWSNALAEGYNSWLLARYCQSNHQRIKGVALLPLQDIKSACKQLRHIHSQDGIVGVCITAVNLSTLPLLGHEYYFPLYELACELNCMIGIHGAPTVGLGLDGLDDFAAVHALSHPFAQIRQCASMIMGGIFEKFPTLRVAFLEGGIEWIPFLLGRLDEEYAKRKVNISSSPTEQIRKSSTYFICELGEKLIPKVAGLIGNDKIISTSDFPHEPANEYGEVLKEFMKRDDLTPDLKQAILYDNAKKLYSF